MPDYWLHKLVAQGPRRDIAKFRRAAAANRTSRSEGSPLSFKRLMSALPTGVAMDENLLWIELLDLVVDPTTYLKYDMAEVTYNFQLTKVDFEPLLFEVSCIYPTLCFILGTVASGSGQTESCFVHNGQLQVWRLPDSEYETFLANVPEDSDQMANDGDDEVLWALTQADWAMMDAVVDHWAATAEKTRATVAADMHASTGSD